MYSKVLVVLAVAALACANDIFQGSENTAGKKPSFEGHFEGAWGVTRATKDVFVNGSGVITAINVTDLREAKDGDASILSGGVGHANVTISLKSPAAFRGFDFMIQVYSEDAEVQRGSRDLPSTPGVTVSPATESKPTGKPTVTDPTELPTTDKAITTPTTGKPDVDSPTVTFPTGKPTEATGVPKVMEIPEEVEEPKKHLANTFKKSCLLCDYSC